MSGWHYLSLNSALRAVETHTATIVETERVPLDQATGRRISSDLVARFDLPPWNRSAVDGYALRSNDTKRTLRFAGHVFAGEFFGSRLRRGECVYIATGAPLPEGADAVAMKENAVRKGDSVEVRRVEKWENVSRKGSDVRRGSVLVTAGSVINAGAIAAASSQGMQELEVYRRPRVLIVPGGNEVRPLTETLSPGQIYDVNSHVVASMASGYGAMPVIRRPIEDSLEEALGVLNELSEYDGAVFCSGSSVGERDFVARAIEASGTLVFHGVRMRPGRPSMFGVVGGKPVLGLPGYPVSSFVGAHYLLRACLEKLSGIRYRRAEADTAFHGTEKAHDEFDSIIPVRIRGRYSFSVFRESGAVTSMCSADGLLRIPAGRRVRDGQTVRVELLHTSISLKSSPIAHSS